MSSMPPAVGQPAPEFTLPDQYGKPVALTDLHADKSVLLVFYPFAFSGICTGELQEIRDDLGRFQNDAVEVAALSCDPMFALRAWDDKEGYFFPLLSDFWPHGDVAKAYGVFEDVGGFARRGTFLVGVDGTVRWSLINGPGERRDFAPFHEMMDTLGTR
ncbi:MAG TPA: peroxiredoxin [Dermatophilaceae bacterium]|nr:peroxiredoxin [Dermatophilaceae bacterium]